MEDSPSASTLVCAGTELPQEKEVGDRTARPRHRKLIGVLIIVALLMPFTAGFERAGPPMDEGSLLIYPELIGHGALPYRDFETFYGPANIYVLATIYSLFGTGVMVERAVGLLYQALILSLVFALISRWSVALAACCSALAAWILMAAGIAAYAWFGGMACLLASLLVMIGTTFPARFFLAGLLGGYALLYRVDLTPAIFLSALPLLHLAPLRQRIRYFAGITAGLLPLGLLACWVTPRELINNLFLYPVFYSSPARHLPMFTVEPFLYALFLTHLLAAALNIVAGTVAVRTRPSEPRSRLLLSLALLGAMLTAQAAQRLDLFHFTCAAFLTIGMLPLSVLVLASGGRERRLTLAQVCLASLIVFVAIETVAPELEPQAAVLPELKEGHFVQHAGRSFPHPSPEEARDLASMLDWLEKESTTGQRLFVGPADLRRTSYCDTFLYYLIPKLRPSSYFLEMNPLSANRAGSRLAADVASADWLVLNRALDGWKEKNRSLEFQSDVPNQVVRDKFQLAGKFGHYLVLERKSSNSQINPLH